MDHLMAPAASWASRQAATESSTRCAWKGIPVLRTVWACSTIPSSRTWFAVDGQVSYPSRYHAPACERLLRTDDYVRLWREAVLADGGCGAAAQLRLWLHRQEESRLFVLPIEIGPVDRSRSRSSGIPVTAVVTRMP